MKKQFVFAFALMLCATVLVRFSKAEVSNFPLAAFKWSQTEFDFGTIKKGVPVTHTFKFTNSGNEPLVISSVQASCGCTVTDYSKQPIESGAEGFVKATYNAGSLGAFNKTVTVLSNAGQTPVSLTIKGNVVE